MLKYLVFVIVSLAFISCSGPTQQDQKQGKVITDALGREVTVPKQIHSIVGLRAGAMRLLVYMDATKLICGIEEGEKRGNRPYILAHPELLDLPVIGPIMGGEAELILKSGAEVIFMSYTTPGDADALQNKTGIPVVAIECPELATQRKLLYNSFQIIGNVLNRQSRADSLIQFIHQSIGELHNRTKNISIEKKPTAYIGGVSYSGSHGINSTQPYYPPFVFTNTRNVASDINDRLISHVKGTFVDIEKILFWNPDYIFVDQSGLTQVKTDLSSHPQLRISLDAIRENRVYSLYPYNNYATNYELALVNSWYVGKVLYPMQFKDVEITEKTSDILNMLLGKHIYKEVTKLQRAIRPIDKTEF